MNIQGEDITIQGRLIRIARPAYEGFEFLENPEAVLDGLRHSGRRIDLFTFIQRLPNTDPQYSYPFEWGNFAALSVSTFDHWWTRQIDGKTRNMVRRAEKKGVVVREVPFDDTLVKGIWEIYNECPVRQGRHFPHYGKDIDTVRNMSATFMETSFFIGAFLGEQLIGFAKLTTNQTRSQAAVMHILSMIQHREKSPTNALIAQMVRSCAERGLPYLVYSSFVFGNKNRDSLSDFKESNGFRRVDVPRYYVPLTRVGSLAFHLGLHHSFLEHVPEWVFERFRNLRSAWYNRKLQSTAVAS